MNIARVDLNLLAVFDAIAASRSVTVAAIQLNLSQPAVSHALNRLRKVTGDPLFVRSGQGLIPTPAAQLMQAQARDVLEAARLILARQLFDPSHDARTFRIAASDYAALTIIPRLLQQIRRMAPGITIELAPVGRSSLEDMERGAIALSFWGASSPTQPLEFAPLFDEHFVGIVCRSHPLAAYATVNLDDYLSFPHAIIEYGVSTTNPVQSALNSIGRTRNVQFVGQSFSGNFAAMRGTDLVMAVPSRLIGHAELLGFRPFSLPVAIAPFPYGIVWHHRTETDPAHVWLRTQIIAIAGDNLAPDQMVKTAI